MKLLLLGHGYWGAKLRAKFDELLGVENVMVFDSDPKKLPKEAARRIFTGDTGKLAESISFAEAVVVATPPASHFEIAREALEQRKHVLVEKPMTMRVTEAKELAALAQRKHCVLMCDDTWQYHDRVQDLLDDALRSSTETTAHLVWVNPREQVSPEGILWTQGPHPVSILLSVIPKAWPYDVFCSTDERHIEIVARNPDDFESRSSTITLSWNTSQKTRCFWVQTRKQGTPREQQPYGDFLLRLFSDGDGPPREEPLAKMCRTFLARCGTVGKLLGGITIDSIDYHSIEVVRFLEATQRLMESKT